MTYLECFKYGITVRPEMNCILYEKNQIVCDNICLKYNIKRVNIDRSSHDIMAPKEDIMAREVGYVLHEWNAIWKDLYVVSLCDP